MGSLSLDLGISEILTGSTGTAAATADSAIGASVSWLQSPDMPLYLTGPKGPLRSAREWIDVDVDLELQLHDVTDDFLAGLLHLFPKRSTALTITGKQRQHPELTMYCWPGNGADTE